jgi:hypothetical protein
MEVQAAAISIAGERFVVVLSGPDLVHQPGEADLAIETLSGHFGGVDIVLMGQKDDGSPVYYGARELVALLRDVPVDRMPWKTHRVG